jgi:predicted metal-dependent peptidase
VVPVPAIVVDTSGSMGRRELATAVGNVAAILSAFRAGGPIPVIACDAAVQARTHAWSADAIDLSGGGGSDMRPGISAAVGGGADVVVVITDGFVDWPSKAPLVPVVVAIVRVPGYEPPAVPRWASTVELPEAA